MGRPNVGKSTLFYRLTSSRDAIVADFAGLTRDAIAIKWEYEGREIRLVDTAGMRRKSRVEQKLEKLSVADSLRTIRMAQVVVLVLDGALGFDKQDLTIADHVLQEGRALVIAINKWDAVDAYQREQIERQVETRLAFLKFASLHLISAQKRQGLGPVWKSITQAHASAMRKMSTPVLTRLLMEAVAFQAPTRSGMFRPKMRYAHQGGMNPPVIVIHGNSLENVPDAYKRFLEGRFRKAFDLVGTPLRIEFKTSANPFKE